MSAIDNSLNKKTRILLLVRALGSTYGDEASKTLSIPTQTTLRTLYELQNDKLLISEPSFENHHRRDYFLTDKGKKQINRFLNGIKDKGGMFEYYKELRRDAFKGPRMDYVKEMIDLDMPTDMIRKFKDLLVDKGPICRECKAYRSAR